MGKIHLNNITFHALHGLHPEEKVIGTYFAVDLILETDFSNAISSDDIQDTVDYQHVYELISKEMQSPSKLIEHLLGRIAGSIQKNIQLKSFELKITKHYPPVKGLNAVSVSEKFNA